MAVGRPPQSAKGASGSMQDYLASAALNYATSEVLGADVEISRAGIRQMREQMQAGGVAALLTKQNAALVGRAAAAGALREATMGAITMADVDRLRKTRSLKETARRMNMTRVAVAAAAAAAMAATGGSAAPIVRMAARTAMKYAPSISGGDIENALNRRFGRSAPAPASASTPAAPASPRQQEAARAAQLLESQAAARQVQGGPDWQPAGVPAAGAGGALAKRRLSDSIPSGTSLPQAVIEPPKEDIDVDEEDFGEDEEDLAGGEEGLDEESAAAVLAESQAAAAVQQAASQAAEQAKAAAAKAAKQVVSKGKDVFIRWGAGAADTFGVSSDASTLGVSFIWDVIMYLATLAWFNVEMIYGYYISGYFQTGEKSLLVSPLSWESLAMDQKPPFPLPDIFLHGALVAVDLTLALTLAVVVTFAGLMLMMLADFVQEPIQTAYSVITGTAEYGFLADVIGPFFSL